LQFFLHPILLKNILNMEKYNICFTSDENYAQHLGVAIVSILKNSNIEDKFYFWVVDDDISQESKDKIEKLKDIKDFKVEYLKVDKDEFSNFPRRKDGLPVNSYFLIKVPNLLKNVDKILFLDCDIVVKKNISDIFKIDIDDKYILAVEDINGKQFSEERSMKTSCFYFNSGVFVLNCKKWREEGLEQKCFDYVKENGHTFKFQDQEVLNGVLCENAKKIGLEWNFQYIRNYVGGFNKEEFNEVKKDPAIIHYITGEKPWKISNVDKIIIEYWRYLSMTPFFMNNIEKFEERINLMSDCMDEYVNLKTELDSTKIGSDLVRAELDCIKTELESAKSNLATVYKSWEWRLAIKIQKMFKLIFPKNSLRRKLLNKLLNKNN